MAFRPFTVTLAAPALLVGVLAVQWLPVLPPVWLSMLLLLPAAGVVAAGAAMAVSAAGVVLAATAAVVSVAAAVVSAAFLESVLHAAEIVDPALIGRRDWHRTGAWKWILIERNDRPLWRRTG